MTVGEEVVLRMHARLFTEMLLRVKSSAFHRAYGSRRDGVMYAKAQAAPL